MANARHVLEVTVREAALLATTGGTLEQIAPLAILARTALDAGDGDVPDDVIRESALHASQAHKILGD